MTLIPTVDALACAAHGDCAEIAPEIFRIEETAVVIPGALQDELVLAAAEVCPAVAISVVDARTGERVYP
jgi:ferredoxin